MAVDGDVITHYACPHAHEVTDLPLPVVPRRACSQVISHTLYTGKRLDWRLCVERAFRHALIADVIHLHQDGLHQGKSPVILIPVTVFC